MAGAHPDSQTCAKPPGVGPHPFWTSVLLLGHRRARGSDHDSLCCCHIFSFQCPGPVPGLSGLGPPVRDIAVHLRPAPTFLGGRGVGNSVQSSPVRAKSHTDSGTRRGWRWLAQLTPRASGGGVQPQAPSLPLARCTCGVLRPLSQSPGPSSSPVLVAPQRKGQSQ